MTVNNGLLTKDYGKYLSCGDDTNVGTKNRNIQAFLDAFQIARDERTYETSDERDDEV